MYSFESGDLSLQGLFDAMFLLFKLIYVKDVIPFNIKVLNYDYTQLYIKLSEFLYSFLYLLAILSISILIFYNTSASNLLFVF